VQVHFHTMSKQSWRRMPRVCTGTVIHYEQTFTEGDAVSVYGYTGTLRARSGTACHVRPSLQ